MESTILTLCNKSHLSVLDIANINNHSIYYLDDCFQQSFIVIPIYLLLLVAAAFYLGLYSALSTSLYLSLRLINLITFGRYFSILVVACLQVSIYLCELSHVSLIAQLVTLLKLCTLVTYLLFLFKCARIFHFEDRFKLFKFSFLLVVGLSLSECFTAFLEAQNQAVAILCAVSSVFWFVHFCFLIKYDHSHQYVSQVLINAEIEDRDEDEHLLPCDEKKSLLNRGLFLWVGPLLDRGVQKGIESSRDLFELPFSLSSLSVSPLVDHYLQDYQQRHYLMKCLFRQFGWQLLFAGLMKLSGDALSFFSPIFLNKILLYLEGDQWASKQGFNYALALFAGTLFNSIIISYFNFYMSKLSLKVRTVLVTIIYHKLFRVRSTTLAAKFGTGQVLNLANTDIERVVNFGPSVFQFVSLPMQLVITLYLLYDEVGIVFLSAVIFILALIPLNKVICNKIGTFSQEMMKWKDKRIKLMTEILRGIRTIKMHFWERSFIEKVQLFRSSEVKYLRWRKYLDALCVYFWATTPVIISSLVFGTYAYFNGTDSLTSSKVFTSLALLSMLIMPLNALPWVLNGLIEALVSVRRLDEFFTLSEFNLSQDYALISQQEDESTAFALNDCTFDYISSSGAEANGNFKLSHINMRVPHNSFIAIIGKVGSGKSSLLLSLINELNRLEGTLQIDAHLLEKGIGYVSQEPWIQETTIRENILFGKEFNAQLYHQVIDACALITDFKLFPNGDQTMIGNHGATLSGGQKSRISLARALYQDFNVYLIDEPFASVDVKVAHEIYEKCFEKMLLNKKCIILATNHLNYLRKADVILSFDNGAISRSMTGVELFENMDESRSASLCANPKEMMASEAELDAPEEVREYGFVKWSVYLWYVQSIGYCLFALILASICLMQISKTSSDFWLSYWTQNKSSGSALPYLYIFICIAIANSIFTLIRAFIFAYGGVKAAITLHDRLLTSIVKTSLLFFDLTAFGVIINRFSSDVFNVDDALPFTINIFFAQLSGLVASLVVTVWGMPWIFFLIVPLIIPYYLIQKYFRATSRELKRLSAVSLSPIYSQLDDTIQGLCTIRAFVQTQRFKEDFYANVNVYNRIQYTINAVQQWLNLRLQLLGVLVTAAVAFIAVSLHFYHTESVNSGMIGLALVYSLSLTSLLNGAVQSFTQTELDLISVERINQILKLVTEQFNLDQGEFESSLIVDNTWPSNGIIRFNNVSMRYRPDLELAIKDVSFVTEAAEHIAIVGRTGSGKSSLFQALFRLTSLSSGSISIDGVDISLISLELLRSKIFIIPQDPFLFSATIRDNLDPQYEYRDDEIWTALYNCNINILVDSLGGLDAELRENGKDLSVGQRHLFCLARAVLNKKKILCMDEVTASIDPETEESINELVRTSLRHCTVLNIAHKIDSIRNYDRVIVMDAGRIVDICSSEQYLQQRQQQ